MTALLWSILFRFIPILLGVTKGLIDVTVAAVQEAESASPPVDNKQEFVMTKVKSYVIEQGHDFPQRIINCLIEFAVVYVKK